MDEIDDGKRSEKDKVGAKERRGLIVKWAAEAVAAARNKPNLFKHEWINFGSYLPMDGSKDGDMHSIAD